VPFIDDRGRLFGRINLIDLAVIVLVLLVIPVGYGAYRLFREPAPTILTVEPAQVLTTNLGNVKVTGEHLRDQLKARVGSEEATLLVANPTTAELKLSPKLTAGTYDVVLYEQGGREISKKAQAITILSPAAPPPPAGLGMEMQAVGAFVSVNDDEVKQIRSGVKFFERSDAKDAVAEVLAVQPPGPVMTRVKTGPSSAVSVAASSTTFQVPAIVRLRCIVSGEQCRVGDYGVSAGGNVALMIPAAAGVKDTKNFRATFRIDELRPADTPAAFPSVREMRIQAVGAFISMPAADARLVQKGAALRLPAAANDPRTVGDVLATKAPVPGTQRIRLSPNAAAVITSTTPGIVEVPVILQLRCQIVYDQCRVNNNMLARDTTVGLSLVVQASAGASGGTAPVWFDEREVTFRIDEIRSADVPAVFPAADALESTVRVQFLARPEIAALIKVGDVDPTGPASLTAVMVHPEPVTVTATVPGPIGPYQAPQAARVVDATVRVTATPTVEGWQYQLRILRAGESFTFTSPSYTIAGTILQAQPPPDQRRASTR
jgi:hypothetical protein